MFPKLKKIIVFLFVTALVMMNFTACAGSRNIVLDNGGSVNNDEARLNFFGFKYESINVTAVETALQGYMQDHSDINVTYESIKGSGYFDVLCKRLRSGNGDDLFMVDHARVLELSEEGYLADLDRLSTLDTFSDLAKSQMCANGTVYYVPTSISAFGLYCNETLLRAHNQKIPSNLKEFASVLDYFAGKGITPIVANNDISLKTVAIAKAFLPAYQSGDYENIMRRFNNGEEDFAEALRPGLEFVEYMLDKGWADRSETLSTVKSKDDLELFAEGNRPFMLTGAWMAVRLRAMNPSFDFSLVPYPIFDDGSVLVINMDTRISVNADSENLEESINFLEYLTRRDVMWEFVNSQCSFSPLNETRISEDSSVKALAPYINNGRSVLGSDDRLRFPVWDITKECVEIMLEGASAEDAVSYLRTQIQLRSIL